LLFFPLPQSIGTGLKVGFYNKSCASVETLVQQAVVAAFKNNCGIAAGLIRLHFDDCALFYRLSTAVEAQCPSTFSCADILAFAARDSVALTGNLTYKVPAGAARRPGVQGDRRALTLPSPFSNATELVGKGLTPEDMVVLSGAHTVGQSHCSSFLHRIWNGTTAIVDPTISAAYASLLRSICPSNSNQTFPNTTTAMDLISHDTGEARQPLLRRARQQPGPLHVGLGAAHQRHAQRLKASVDAFVKSEKKWKSKFAKSMVKMGNIQVLTGTQGEIRLNCRVINSGGSSSSAGVELGMMTRSDGLDEI
ncbi:hypothetical protein EJB05_30706, partial [Eragrostis curvula]